MSDVGLSDYELKLLERANELGHAIQSGVLYTMDTGGNEHEPKILRTCINISMCDHVTLLQLLIDKGIITREEYFEKRLEYMEREVKNYENNLSKKVGKRITLE
jgi:hypothetical protein